MVLSHIILAWSYSDQKVVWLMLSFMHERGCCPTGNGPTCYHITGSSKHPWAFHLLAKGQPRLCQDIRHLYVPWGSQARCWKLRRYFRKNTFFWCGSALSINPRYVKCVKDRRVKLRRQPCVGSKMPWQSQSWFSGQILTLALAAGWKKSSPGVSA